MTIVLCILYFLLGAFITGIVYHLDPPSHLDLPDVALILLFSTIFWPFVLIAYLGSFVGKKVKELRDESVEEDE